MEPSTYTQGIVQEACRRFGNDAHRMMDILWEVQDRLGCIDGQAMECIAAETGSYRVEVEGVVTFYAFFATTPQGQFIIRICEDIIDRHAGVEEIRAAFEKTLGIAVGQTTNDGLFSLHLTPCIGMCDQAPAVLINDLVVTGLTPGKVSKIVSTLKKSRNLNDIKPQSKGGLFKPGEGNNQHPLIRSMVKNNIRLAGEILLNTYSPEAGLAGALQQTPAEVVEMILASGLRGRGGAGFSTGRKWQMAAATEAEERYVICNADEGEPGTFKDRVLLTEKADLLFEGMTIAAYAVGARHGILYLRGEYRYLRPYLEHCLEERRKKGLLGANIGKTVGGQYDGEFDIRIQIGAGAYICGEESSLISSCEGRRGEPKNRPPYPVQSGYLGYPTVVNNVETLCNVPRILEKGISWFRSIGTSESAGTKLHSVSGDCSRPGIYELPMGCTVQELLDLAGAKDSACVQVGGASGDMIGRTEFGRRLCFEDLPTAGAFMSFTQTRNILEIVDYYMHFFIEESCGYCTPCRVGNVFMKKGLEKIIQGQGEPSDLEYLKDLGKTIIETSRCGLGHTSPKPILTSMKHFPLVYAALLKERPDGLQAGFNIQHALDESRIIAKRRSLIYDPDYSKSEKAD
ncbi:NADH:ubiquinone oxidoreductase [Hahella sp. CCB-MM4]|uniref:NAD(P)H-dependent oxidoreductase subunit E n=1 Tax=Hahella sp. (strain CCB-MM4) TaxID=1926491 RepID=UPI000B9B40B2|nr:NAD(P)H-dependent oxidoreductase subunit E [Hahella sp. CCB-MM4]OZG72928.1 NADH:ubiquinone oxidoreductase [Hahella sp. CCB-MM4]